MPSLGENVEAGRITRWLKQAGDSIEAGEPLLEVATDKVDTEIPSPVAGMLAALLVEEDAIVAVGDALAVIEQNGDDPPRPTPPAVTDSTTVTQPNRGTKAQPAPPSGLNMVSATVSMVSTAEHRGAENPSPSGDRVEKLPRIRRVIARRMMESLQTSAQLTSVVEVDVTVIARLRDEHKGDFHRRSGAKLSFFPFFAFAVVKALSDHPVINASLNGDGTEVTYHGAVHLGVAVDSVKGLMVPVIRDAASLRIIDLAIAISRLAHKVRDSTITPDDLAGGTFTITNTGSRGALFDTPIINQPQSAILGVGAVVDRVVPVGEDGYNQCIAVRQVAYLSLSYDHRIVDGADAARFLTAVKTSLEAGYIAEDLA